VREAASLKKGRIMHKILGKHRKRVNVSNSASDILRMAECCRFVFILIAYTVVRRYKYLGLS